MAGDDDYANVVKYNLTNGKVIKKFNNIGVGSVFSITRLNNLCFFGGYDSSFTVIDNKTNKIILKSVNTAIGWICSLQICRVKGSITKKTKYILTVNGKIPNYVNNLTDLFDITKLVNNNCVFPINNDNVFNSHKELVKLIKPSKKEISKEEANTLNN